MTTIVTGIWNIKRDSLGEGWSRSFDHYIENFKKLLQVPNPMFIYIEPEYEHIVWENRARENTYVKYKSVDEFQNNFDFYNKIQEIRTDPKWYNLAGWLKESTQAKLALYNPLVMSKMFMLNDACIFNPFKTENFLWIDGGITNTVHPGYFTHDKVLEKIEPLLNKFLFVCFPYKASTEIHGFKFSEINKIANAEVEWVARGGIFGGNQSVISDFNSKYYHLLSNTLSQGLMGTEESIFSIMTYLYADQVNRVMIEENGMLFRFFEDLKNNAVTVNTKEEPVEAKVIREDWIHTKKTQLHVLSYNSPAQFQLLIDSFLESCPNFLKLPTKYLIDNSSNTDTREAYDRIALEHDFIIVRKGNLGICGGRQLVAEIFHDSKDDYCIFFEDDMLLHTEKTQCRNGFNTYVPKLYENIHAILEKEQLDYLKLNFTEFYGDNSTQWAWYNVPQHVREEHFPEKPKLPVQGLDKNAPLTQFSNVKSFLGVPYALGDAFYCNWPLLFSKKGNQKMFIDTKFAHPYEQTWISLSFQKLKSKELKAGILLASPINHNRVYHYSASERREN